jgi:hypothetical protein
MYKKYITTLMLLLIFNHVFSQSDGKAPVLVSINSSPDTISTKTSSASVSIKLIVTDDVSGFSTAAIFWQAPNGQGNLQYADARSNSKLRDTIVLTSTFPKFSDSGVWKIHYLQLTDVVGNMKVYNLDELSKLGKASVYVTSNPDGKAPVLVSINSSPDTISTKTSSASVSIKLIVTDDVSGFSTAAIFWQAPNGQGNLQFADARSNSKLRDTIVLTSTFPKFSDLGVWKIHYLQLTDVVGNMKVYNLDELSKLGKASVINDNNAEIKNGAAFLIQDAYNIKSRSADVISTMSISGNSSSYHDIRWQYQKGDLIGVNPEEQNLVIVDGATTLSNVNGGGNLINLSPGTKYSFRLVSKNKNGNIQDFSDTKQFITLGNTSPKIYDTSFSIKDSVSVNRIVGKIRSVDIDADVLVFKIKSGNTNETFKIDSLGNIFVKNKIEYDKSNKFDLLISVNDGIDSITAKATINITPIPTFNHSGVFGVCTGDSLKVNTNKYSGYTIVWYKNGQIFNNQNIDTIYIKEATNYQIKIIKGADTIASVIKTFIINTIPSSPAASAKNLCQNEAGASLSATATFGNSLIWYGTNATGGSSSTTAPIFSTASTGTVDYYVSQKNITTGCESPRTKLSVTINPLPVSPTVRDTSFCQNSTSIVLSAGASSGNSLLWYGANATGGSSNVNATVPIATSTGSYVYYVSQKNTTTGCESPRSKIGVTINSLPIAPVVRDTNYCNNASSDTLRFNTSTGATLLWYGTNATGGTGTSIGIKPSTATVGTASYYLSQIITTTGCEGPRSKVVVITKPLPNAPTISRDTANYLVSGTSATTWYKDGAALTDTTQKYKPTTPGSYTAKTTSNGCASIMSAVYYYLVTDIINLSKDEFIKLAPNPFINKLNFDFVVMGYQKLNIEVFSMTSGVKVASMQNLQAGLPIYLGQLAPGTYIINVTSNDNKISHQFKMIKL